MNNTPKKAGSKKLFCDMPTSQATSNSVANPSKQSHQSRRNLPL